MSIEAIQPYIPSCSSYDTGSFWSKWESRGPAFNLSNAGNYVYDQVVPSIVPGIVFGVLALVGFLCFTMWALLSLCCACWGRCCKCCRRPAPAPDAGASQQFLSTGSGQPVGTSSPYDGLGGSGKQGGRRLLTWRNAFWAFFVGCGLATIGVAIWGLVESVDVTNYTVSDFWDIVADVQVRVDQTATALKGLESATSELSTKADVISSNNASIASALANVGFDTAQAATATDVLGKAADALGKAPPVLANIVTFLSENVNETINSLYDRFEPPTMAIQETWRFLPIAIVFGVMIGVVAATLVAVWFMSWPRTTAFIVALLFLIVALLMLLGTGLMNGVYVVSNDACLFAESFVIDYAKRKLLASPWGQTVVDMIKFYISSDGDVTGAGAAGVQNSTQAVYPFLPAANETQVEAVLGYLDELKPYVGTFKTIIENPELTKKLEQQLANVPGALEALSLVDNAVVVLNSTAANLTELANLQNAGEVYRDTKTYICCGLKDTAYNMWVAWTVAGCLGFVLALLASGRLIYAARQRRKAWKMGQAAAPGAAILWAQPPSGAAPPGAKVYEAPEQFKVEPLAAQP